MFVRLLRVVVGTAVMLGESVMKFLWAVVIFGSIVACVLGAAVMFVGVLMRFVRVVAIAGATVASCCWDCGVCCCDL